MLNSANDALTQFYFKFVEPDDYAFSTKRLS